MIVGMGLAVLSRCSGTWVSSVGGEGCEQAEHERRAGEGEQRIVKQCFLGAQALGLVLLVEKDASKLNMNDGRAKANRESSSSAFSVLRHLG